MITLKEIIDKYSITVPSWVPETMLNFDMMDYPKNLFPEVEKYYVEKNINDPERKENVIIYGRFADNGFLFKITINSWDKIEKEPLVEIELGNATNFYPRPNLIQWNSDGKELDIAF